MADFGAELRRVREQRGLGIRRCAAALNISPGQLSKIETGDRTVTAGVPNSADILFNTGDKFKQLFRETRSAHTNEKPSDVEEDSGIVVPFYDSAGRTKFMPTSRRKFIKALGPLAASAFVGGTAGATPAVPVIAPTDSGLDLAEHPVETLQRWRELFIDEDNAFGPVDVIPKVWRALGVTEGLRQESSGGDRLALVHMEAQLAEFLGWLCQDLGDHTTARWWMDHALRWSNMAGTTDLTTFILARQAQLAGDSRKSADTIDAAHAALANAQPRSRLAAVAATFAAEGHALASDATGAQQAIDNAHNLFADLDSDPGPWGVWLDHGYIEVHKARALSTLGQYDLAAEGFQAAINSLPVHDYTRDTGVYLARQALAHAGAHDANQAAEVGTRALSIARRARSGRIVNELLSLDVELLPASTNPNVAQFRAAVRDTIGQATT